jgi:hypothetical protein
MSKPREFWIEYCPDKSITHLVDEKPIKPEMHGEWANIVRVIEHSAFEQLRADAERLCEALEKIAMQKQHRLECPNLPQIAHEALANYRKRWAREEQGE